MTNPNIANTYRIDCLTSLRFIAASMIVVHHSRGTLYLKPDFLEKIPFDHAVSFFFILSGFILTYNYPKFEGVQSVIKFYIARLAKIWPIHISSFLLLFIIFLPWSYYSIKNFPNNLDAVLNILMVQGWIPIKRIYFSYNWLSWAISTEFFFYLSFPFLINNFGRTYKYKLCGSFLLVIILIFVCTYSTLTPELRTGILYINPLSRLFEFILGMSTAFLWENYHDHIRLNKFSATLVEICALGGAIVSIYYSFFLIRSVGKYIGTSSCEYLCHTSSAIPFAVLIFFMAMQKGILSRIFQYRGMVLLGETSFAIFMFHQIILRFYVAHLKYFSFLPTPILYGLFWIFLILLSIGILFFIEKPSQRFIMNLYKKK